MQWVNCIYNGSSIGAPIDKASFDKAWSVANETMAKTGNWGGVKKGVTHVHGYATAFGGYGLIDVDDPKAFDEYQLLSYQQLQPHGDDYIRAVGGPGRGVGPSPRRDQVQSVEARLPTSHGRRVTLGVRGEPSECMACHHPYGVALAVQGVNLWKRPNRFLMPRLSVGDTL